MALTDLTSSVDEAVLEKCRILSLNRLTPDLGILACKVRRGAPLNDAVITQTGLERLDFRFPLGRNLPVKRRERAIGASLSQKEPDAPDRALFLRGRSPPGTSSYRLRTLRVLNHTACCHTQTSLLAARSCERAAGFLVRQVAPGGPLPQRQPLLVRSLGLERTVLQQPVFTVADHLLLGVLSHQQAARI